MVPALWAERTAELLIESRSTEQDRRDQGTMIEPLHDVDHSGPTYRCGVKTTPTLRLADAVAEP